MAESEHLRDANKQKGGGPSYYVVRRQSAWETRSLRSLSNLSILVNCNPLKRGNSPGSQTT